MAEETSTVEKIYCTDSNSSLNPMLSALLTNQNQHDPMLSAMMANGGGMNNQWNNPFIYLVWLMFAQRFGWGSGTDTQAENYNSRAIAALQGTVTDNHNNDIALQAINGNRDALGQLAQTFNTDLSSITAAVADVRSAIQTVGGQIGYSAESVKNAIALGDSNIVAKMQECCCSNKLLTQQMGYEAQLRDQANTGLITSQMAAQHSADMLQDSQYQAATMSRIDQLANGITQGFSQVGYANQQNTQAIISNATANTQRILDQMCSNTTQELRDKLAQMSQDAQTAKILASVGTTTTNTVW